MATCRSTLTPGALVAMFCSSWLADVPQYTITDLGAFPRSNSILPLALNNAAEVVGYTQWPGTLLRAFTTNAKE